jgi:hypothetical protein
MEASGLQHLQPVPEDEDVWGTRRHVRSDALAAAVERAVAELTASSTVYLAQSSSSSPAMLYGASTLSAAVMSRMSALAAGRLWLVVSVAGWTPSPTHQQADELGKDALSRE